MVHLEHISNIVALFVSHFQGFKFGSLVSKGQGVALNPSYSPPTAPSKSIIQLKSPPRSQTLRAATPRNFVPCYMESTTPIVGRVIFIFWVIVCSAGIIAAQDMAAELEPQNGVQVESEAVPAPPDNTAVATVAAPDAAEVFAGLTIFIPQYKASPEDPPGAQYVDTDLDPEGKISLRFDQAPFPEVLRILVAKTGKRFAVDDKAAGVLMTINVHGEKWTTVLNQLIAQYDLIVESLPSDIIKFSKEVDDANTALAQLFLVLFQGFLFLTLVGGVLTTLAVLRGR